MSNHASEYFIGVHARELERLRDQHEAWRPETEALWTAAGFREGLHLADLGSGPGYTTFDLAQRVGASGSVTAVDMAAPYLSFLEAEAHRRRLTNVCTLQADVTRIERLDRPVQGVFCRFLLAFLIPDLERVAGLVYRSLEPGGVFAAMEYLTLGSTTCSPPVRGFDAHTRAWTDYYGKHGGDTRVGTRLPAVLTAAGFEITHIACAGGMADPSHRWWRWWGRLIENFGETLAAEDCMTAEDLTHLRREWAALATAPNAFIHTPLLAQVVARKP